MIFTALDLEMSQPSGKIIQIGAVVGDVFTGEIKERLSVFTQIDEPLSEFIIQLTGITEQQLIDEGVTLREGYDRLVAMHLRHGSFCNPITWGGGDSLCLRDQLGLAEERFLFGRRFFDVKTLYQSYQLSQGQKIANGLSKAMAKMGLNFKGRKHTADADAENTFVFFCHMLKKFRK